MKKIKLTTDNVKNFEFPGVYQIYIYSDSKPLDINRICGTDSTGLMYIGSSRSSVSERLRCFINSCDSHRKQRNHSAGVKIKTNLKLQELINKNDLYFICLEIKESDPHEVEMKTIMEYRTIFGEVPPLNG